MSDPLASLLVPQMYQDTDGLITEPITIPATGPYTWRLGSGLTPPYPSGAPLIPGGAAPLPAPPALTAGAGVASGGLVSNGTYSWAMTLVTKYGETTPSTLLPIAGIGAGNTGQTLNLPTGTTGTGTNPVVMRRIWRYKNGGSQLYLVAEIDDANVSVYVDEVPDSALVTIAPTSNTSGLEGAVAIIGTNSASNTTWTEMPEGATLTAAGQFTVAYDISGVGGTITFYSGDHGLSVSAQYTAGTELGSGYFNLYMTALVTARQYLQDVLALYGTFPNPNSAHTPTVVGNYATGFTPGGRMALYEHHLLVPTNTGWWVLDIADPAHPTQIAFTAISGQCRAIAVMGQFAFVANGSTIYCYALYAPQTPVSQTNIAAGDTVLDLAVQGRYLVALLGGATNKIKVWDMGATPGSGGTLYATGNNTYSSPVAFSAFEDAYVNVIDSGNLWGANIPSGTGIGENTDAFISTPVGICAVQGMLAVANGGSSVVAFYKDNAGAQNRVATLTLPAVPTAIAAAGEHVYVTSAGLLHIIDVGMTGTPTLLTGTGLSVNAGSYSAIHPVGGHLALANSTDGKIYFLNLDYVRLASATIGTLKVGRIWTTDGVTSMGPLRGSRLDIGRGGGYIDGDVGVGAGLSVEGHVTSAAPVAVQTTGAQQNGSAFFTPNASITGLTGYALSGAPVSDDCGYINFSFTSGSIPASTILGHVTFGTPYKTVPIVVGNGLASVGVYGIHSCTPYNVTTTGFDVYYEGPQAGTALSATNYAWSYIVKGR